MPDEIGGAKLDATLMREWPGMDSREATVTLLERASAAIGRPIVGGRPRRGERREPLRAVDPAHGRRARAARRGAHAPHEFVLASGLRPRAEVALAIAAAVLGD